MPSAARSFLRIRHQALATGLVYGRTKSIGDQNVQTFLPQGDRGCQAGGTASDDECITADHLPLQQQHLGAESRAHGRQHAARSRFGTAMGHHLIQNHQHRGRGQITYPLQRFP